MVKFQNDATGISRDHMNADFVEKDTFPSETSLEEVFVERNYTSCETMYYANFSKQFVTFTHRYSDFGSKWGALFEERNFINYSKICPFLSREIFAR